MRFEQRKRSSDPAADPTSQFKLEKVLIAVWEIIGYSPHQSLAVVYDRKKMCPVTGSVDIGG